MNGGDSERNRDERLDTIEVLSLFRKSEGD